MNWIDRLLSPLETGLRTLHDIAHGKAGSSTSPITSDEADQISHAMWLLPIGLLDAYDRGFELLGKCPVCECNVQRKHHTGCTIEIASSAALLCRCGCMGVHGCMGPRPMVRLARPVSGAPFVIKIPRDEMGGVYTTDPHGEPIHLSADDARAYRGGMKR